MNPNLNSRERKLMITQGRKLIALRRKKGWTRGQAAEVADMHPSNLLKYELAQRIPQTLTLYNILERWGFTLKDFVKVHPYKGEIRCEYRKGL